MKEAQPRHTVNSDLSFRHFITFDSEFTSYCIDYVDSNGDRHSNQLAEFDFTDTTIPILRRSSLEYFPAHTGYRHESDYFLGQVVCDNPTFGMEKTNRLSHIRQLLVRRLKEHVPNHSICHQDGYIRIKSNADPVLIADIYTESFANNSQIQFELLVPTSNALDDEERYDDLCFTSEVWVLIHDFCANLSVELEQARHLARVSFSPNHPHQTLQVGHELAHDACRFGIELLRQAVHIDRIDFSKDLNIRELDETFAELQDSMVESVIRRALTLAYYDKKRTLTPEFIIYSLDLERDLVILQEGRKDIK